MPFEWQPVKILNLGVNYRNLVATRNSRPGEAQDALNVLPREDGPFYKTFGWLRKNASALNGTPLAMQGFTYRGKNTVAGDARAGNWGQPNDGADFTRRLNEFPGFLLLTTTDAYVWDPLTETFTSVIATLPVGVSIAPVGKPTIEIAQDNCYIVGWADKNLRFDPTDQSFYRWGWEQEPTAASIALQGGGDLTQNATYQYGVSFVDIYTGEESKMSDLVSARTSDANRTIAIDVSTIVYAGNRHSNTVPGGTRSDVAVVIWRSGADDNSPRFLTILNPGETTFTDDGLARETSLRPYRGEQVDEPLFSSLKLFKGIFYAISRADNSNRVYFNHFDKNTFFERWRPLGFKDLEVPDGEVLTAVGGTDATLLIYSQRGAFRMSVATSATQIQRIPQRLPWHVGCVGPRARITVDGWEYFLSERGPYRWKEGLIAPDEIGENLLPIFVDPMSNLCKLNAENKDKSECNFDWQSNTVRFTFPVGDATLVNRHMAYWILADQYLGNSHLGWWPQSPDVQAMDLTSALIGSTGGVPDAPREGKQNLVWADSDGYVYEYMPDARRAGLADTEVAVTTVDAIPGATTITAADTPLYTTGDGLKGLRLEIESQPDADGNTTVEVYEILSNTATTITIVGAAFTRTPVVGDAVRIAGIPAFWRSWFDHLGLPHQHKTMMDFSVGYQDRVNVNGAITVLVSAGEMVNGVLNGRTEQAQMDRYRKKFTVARTGVFFSYEFSNSMPDEMFVVTDLDREVEVVPARRNTYA